MRGFTAAGIILAVLAGPAQANLLYHWAELGDGESATIRAISDGACPAVMFDGIPSAMATRSEPATRFENVKQAVFDVTGCEVAIPRGVKSASIEGEPVNLPHPDPRRIVIFGDKGCRIAKGDRVQACNDPKSWPFPEVAARSGSNPSRPRDSCRRLSLPGRGLPCREYRLCRHAAWLWLGHLGR